MMKRLNLPSDPAVLAAVGRVAIRHGQLQHVLRMTVKSILGLPAREALDATARQNFGALRERVRRLAKQRLGEGEALCRLDAILYRAHAVTKHRNRLIHDLWAHDPHGNPIIRDDERQQRPIPDAAALEELAEQIHSVAADLDAARLEGFLATALRERLP
jgi:hypothetical protein